VVLTPQGSAVLLQSKGSGRILPIFVGGTEALSIDLRNESRRFQRPLTHDLFDDVVSKLGGKLVKVHVDSLRSNTFIGRVFLRQEGRSFDVDARPSDAIALAIGNRVPIFVAARVFEEAGMRLEDLSVADPDELPAAPMGRPRDPMQL
jgi:bifunctional DNase/RNase